jgi:hypothetical protein
MIRSRVGSVAINVHGTEGPTDAEWAEWINEYRIVAGKLKAILVYSLGGGPNGQQRAQLTDLFPQLERVPQTYVVTSSVAMRGIVTAIRWFLPASQRVKVYAPQDLEKALVEMGLTNEERAEVTRAVKAHLKTIELASDTRKTG